jgi:hypothetical protein
VNCLLIILVSPDLRPARIRVIFDLPRRLRRPGTAIPKRLAYVEWFTPLGPRHPVHGLRATNTSWRSQTTGLRRSEIIPLDHLVRAAHLTPAYGRELVNKAWDADNVLDLCSKFHLNTWVTPHYTCTLR